jgi:hypothetical protein
MPPTDIGTLTSRCGQSVLGADPSVTEIPTRTAATAGMRPEIAQCRLRLARLYWRTRRSAAGAEHLDAAIAVFRAIGAPFWAERAAAEVSEPD